MFCIATKLIIFEKNSNGKGDERRLCTFIVSKHSSVYIKYGFTKAGKYFGPKAQGVVCKVLSNK